MSLAGVGTSLRVQWRTGWKGTLAWVLGLIAVVVLTTTAITGLYDTPEKLRTYAAASAGGAMRMLSGEVAGLNTLGGAFVHELGFVIAFAIPLMGIALVGRGTRREEETGRLELLLASRMGRQAPLVAAVILALGSLAAVALLTAAAFVASGVGIGGSLAYAGSILGLGAVFVGLTAVLAQVFAHQRSVWAAGLAALVVAYLLRGVGATTGNWLVWVSPLGWYDEVAAFGQVRVLPFVLSGATAAALLALALRLSSGRDVGGALLAARTGPRRASRTLIHPLGLALREHRVTTVGWALVTAVLMGTYGSLTQAALDAFAGNPALAEFLAAGESGIIEPLEAMFVLLLGMLVSAYALQSLGSLRVEELSGRLELQLSGARGRLAWLVPHLLVVLVGALLVGAAGAVALAASTAVSLDDASWFPRIVGASAAYLVVVLLFAGASVALFGWWPRAQPGVWVVFGVAAVLGYMGPGLDLPAVLIDGSPFGLIGQLPAEDVDLTGALIAGLGGLSLLGLGLLGFTRRDLPHR